MKILVACEESQRVCNELRKLGHEAYSCDIIDCSGGHPEWHIKQDVLPLLNGNCRFKTADDTVHNINGQWDMLIAHPPCTYLSNVYTRGHSLKSNTLEAIASRTIKRIEAMQFFMTIINADCEKIAVENPVGVMNTAYRKPDQIIQPYYFAEDEKDKENYVTKKTCLWLKGLPCLVKTTDLPKPPPFRSYKTANGKIKSVCWAEQVSAKNQKERAKLRSKTFPGIAKAMSAQWAGQAAKEKAASDGNR